MLAGTLAERPTTPPPACQRCVHYWVTHQPQHPHGCRAFQLLSRRLPSIEVRATTGQDCAAFEPKPLPPRHE